MKHKGFGAFCWFFFPFVWMRWLKLGANPRQIKGAGPGLTPELLGFRDQEGAKNCFQWCGIQPFPVFFRLNPSPGWWELKIPDFLLLWLLNPPLLAGLNSSCFPRFPGNAFFRTEPDVWGFFGINPQCCARSGAREWAWGGNSWSFLHRDRVLKDGREDLGMVLGCGEGVAQPGSSLENIWSSPQGLGKGEMQI